jgi:methionyl-tRNA formyltransferase
MVLLERGALTCRAQSDEGVTYARKIDKAEARIDFAAPAAAVVAHIHGLSPFPGAYAVLNGQRLKIIAAEAVAASGTPGTVLDDKLTIACAEGAVRPRIVQREGKAQMPVETFLRGSAIAPGTRAG